MSALARPELAAAAALLVALCWVGLAYWLQWRSVGDEVGARLDALGSALRPLGAPTDRYERRAERDYSGDRGVVPTGPPPATTRWGGVVVPRWTDFYAELVDRLGDPLGDRLGDRR